MVRDRIDHHGAAGGRATLTGRAERPLHGALDREVEVRVGKHDELANLAAFLVSDGAAYINGDAVVIDGGKMLQSGGGGASTAQMLDWSDEQWEAIGPKRK